MTTQSPPKSGLDRLGALLIIAVAWLAALVTFVVVWLRSSESLPAGQCSGIGFGCVPTPKDSLELLGFIVGIPATIGWFVLGVIVISLLGRVRNLKWWWNGVLSLGICLLTGALILLMAMQL